ncbi:MAG: hypothetical protein IPK04_14730 [Bdellovibrionales bacterium]|nr:hypothetical protein [Bdellovibrionales bacterium]
MKNAEDLKVVTDQALQGKFKEDRVKQLMKYIEDEMESQARRGKGNKTFLFSSDDMFLIRSFLHDLEKLGYESRSLVRRNLVEVTVSWK